MGRWCYDKYRFSTSFRVIRAEEGKQLDKPWLIGNLDTDFNFREHYISITEKWGRFAFELC